MRYSRTFLLTIFFFLVFQAPIKTAINSNPSFLDFPSKTRDQHMSTSVKKKLSFKEKLVNWVLKKKLRKQRKRVKDLEKASRIALGLGILSIVTFGLLSIIAILNAISVLERIKDENGSKKAKRRAWWGLILGILSLIAIVVYFAFFFTINLNPNLFGG